MFSSIEKGNKDYPPLLSLVKDSPKILYYKGSYNSEIFENCIAFVGSRKMSPYGKRVITELVADLKGLPITIVSGFMRGADAWSHEEALNNNLKTIAVMPCGIDIINPSYQRDLYNSIIEKGGLIISEYPDKLPPRNWMYPRRNRIVAALCKSVVVIEAGCNSGSLITASFGHLYNRPIFAVPGNIFTELSQGTYHLLSTYAKPISSGGEIRKFLGMESKNLRNFYQKSFFNDEILALLNNQPLTFDQLSVMLKTSIAELSSKITLLSMEGLIVEKGGVFYAS